jgi:hypothetical protein
VSADGDLLRRAREARLDPFMSRQVARYEARREWQRREAVRLAGGEAAGGQDQAAAELLALAPAVRGTRRQQVSYLMSRGYPARVAEYAAAQVITGSLEAVPYGGTRAAWPQGEITRGTGYVLR